MDDFFVSGGVMDAADEDALPAARAIDIVLRWPRAHTDSDF